MKIGMELDRLNKMSKQLMLLYLVGLERLSRRGSSRGALPSGVAEGVEHRLVLSRRCLPVPTMHVC